MTNYENTNVNSDRIRGEEKAQQVTHGIANKGFSGMRKVIIRFNFYCILIENRPQSLTCYIAKRCPITQSSNPN